MRETLKMMREIIIGYERQMSIEQLLEEYREKQSPNVLAYLFVTNFGIIDKVSRSYPLLDTQDVASYSLQELDKAIFNYKANMSCNFITFFVACLKNRLRGAEGLLRTDLRFANYYTNDLDECLELEDTTFRFDTFNLDEFGLTNDEKYQCELFIDGYSVIEVAEKLNKTPQGIYYRNKIIGKKLAVGL